MEDITPRQVYYWAEQMLQGLATLRLTFQPVDGEYSSDSMIEDLSTPTTLSPTNLNA